MKKRDIRAVYMRIRKPALGNIDLMFQGLRTGRVPALAVMMLLKRRPRLESTLEALQNSVGDQWPN